MDAYPLRDGRVVDGLTAADFLVFEDRAPQKVELFEFVDGGQPEPESARRDPNSLAEAREALADPRARAFVAYLDIPHVSIAGAHRMRVPLVDFLNRVITPRDVFGVISTAHEPASITFGRKVTSIEDQLRRYWAWGLRDSTIRDPDESGFWACFAYTMPPAPLEQRFVKDGARERPLDAVLIDRYRTDRVLTHLEDLVWMLGGLREGRTTVLLASEGWRQFRRDTVLKAAVESTPRQLPGGGLAGSQMMMFNTVAQGQSDACIQEATRLADLDVPSRFQALIKLANSMNVSFVSVNPLGLPATDTSLGEPMRGFDPTQLASDDLDRLRERQESLIALAENTDGVAAVGNNDLRAAIAPVLDQLRSFYLLGYYSTNRRFDGSTRLITVSSLAPGVSVKARRSYRAPTEAERAARATPVAAPEVDALGRALDVLAGIRSADDRSFNAARYLKADAAPLLGAPTLFRATPSPRSPIVAVTAPVYRRNERVRVEWPITGEVATRTARVVGRDGQPLAVQVNLSERPDGPPALLADAVLAPLAPGDYAIELTVTGRGETRRTYIPFKVVP